jgi:tetratricopeptide (TPR) repeat protein
MRRVCVLTIALLGFVAAAAAQVPIGKRVSIRAGTPEDRALLAITSATDPAQKLDLIEKFLAEFGRGEMALVAYELYIAHYTQAKDYGKVYEYGEKSLALDPDGFSVAVSLFRAAQEQGDAARLFDYGSRVGQILQRFQARPAPEGVNAEDWQGQKATTLTDEHDTINYVEYTLFSTAYNNSNPAAKAAQLEQFADAFPDSSYAANAQALAGATYLQMNQPQKMVAFAEKVLARDSQNVGMMVMLADHWSERGEELDKAEEYAGKVIAALAAAQAPEGADAEQWTRQKDLQLGLAHSALGQVHIRQTRNAQAVESFRAAAPLLKPDAFSYSRNQYRLGFALINLKRMSEARVAFMESAAADTPFRPLAQEKIKTLPAGQPAKRRRP